MYIKKELRNSNFEIVIDAICNGIVAGVIHKDKSQIAYVLLRSATVAWIRLGGGYNNGSDIKSILHDVADEFTAKLTHSLKNVKEKNGDVDNPIVLPKIEGINRKPLTSQPGNDQSNNQTSENTKKT